MALSVSLDLEWLRANIAGLGRNLLETHLRALCDETIALRRENRQLHDNLTATQARCTELLEELRIVRGTPIAGKPLPPFVAAGLNGPAGPSRIDAAPTMPEGSVRVTLTAFADPFDPTLGA